MKHIFASLSLSVLLFSLGCSGKVPLGGKVTFSDDGSPVTKGAVCFQSPTMLAQGAIQSDGTYQMGTDRASDGLPSGEYQVYLVGTADVSYVASSVKGTTGPSQREVQTPVIDRKYESAGTSGLTFTVDGKTRTFDIPVDRPAKK